MPRKGARPPVSARNVVGTGSLPLQPGHYLGAHALDRLGIKARLGQRKAKILEGFVAAFVERAQRAAQLVAPRLEADFDRAALEPIMEFHCVKGAGALIEQAGY